MIEFILIALFIRLDGTLEPGTCCSKEILSKQECERLRDDTLSSPQVVRWAICIPKEKPTS